MENKILKVEIIGQEKQLQTLANFLAMIQKLGSLGASRTLHLWVDGDGAARLKVKFPDLIETSIPQNFDEIQKDTKGFNWYID